MIGAAQTLVAYASDNLSFDNIKVRAESIHLAIISQVPENTDKQEPESRQKSRLAVSSIVAVQPLSDDFDLASVYGCILRLQYIVYRLIIPINFPVLIIIHGYMRPGIFYAIRAP